MQIRLAGLGTEVCLKNRDRCYDFKNIFSQKMAFFTQNKAKLFKKWLGNTAYFFAENFWKSQKVVIITSTLSAFCRWPTSARAPSTRPAKRARPPVWLPPLSRNRFYENSFRTKKFPDKLVNYVKELQKLQIKVYLTEIDNSWFYWLKK
jgi:hypothetical protein